MLDKTYDAKSVEPKIARRWEDADAFRAGANAKPGAESFSIVIPAECDRAAAYGTRAQ